MIGYVFNETDEALARLDDIEYPNETFNVATTPASGEIQPSATQIGTSIYMEMPVHGLCEGIITAIDVRRAEFPDKTAPTAPSDNVIGTFAYYGQDARKKLNGCSGGLVRNSEHDVVGQFCYQVDDPTGLCYNLSIDPHVRQVCGV